MQTVAQLRQEQFRKIKEAFLSLNAEHLEAHLNQHSSLVAATCTNLQNLSAWLQSKRLTLKSYRVRLADGLVSTNRKGSITVSKCFKRTV